MNNATVINSFNSDNNNIAYIANHGNHCIQNHEIRFRE